MIPTLLARRRPTVIRSLPAVWCVLVSGLSGCATIIHGTTQVVPIVSTPAGASVTIDSVPVGTTPFMATLSRSRSHVVTVSTDSLSDYVELSRRLSGWVLGNMFLYYLPALIDLANGAAFKFNDSVSVVFPRYVAGGEMLRFGCVGLDRIRFVRSGSEQSFVYACMDSSTSDHLYVRWTRDAVSQRHSPAIVPLADVRRLDFAAGARWAPAEAHRTGSPLLVDDRLRIRLVDSERRTTGRLVTIDPSDIHLTVGRDTTRLRRSMIASVQSPGGRNFAEGARRALIVGAIVGGLIGAGEDGSVVNPNGPHLMLGAGIGAIVGLVGTPALAPRRWVEVLKW